MQRDELEKAKAADNAELNTDSEAFREENTTFNNDPKEEEPIDENDSPEYIMELATAKFDEAKTVDETREKKEAEEAELLEVAELKEHQEKQLLKDQELIKTLKQYHRGGWTPQVKKKKGQKLQKQTSIFEDADKDHEAKLELQAIEHARETDKMQQQEVRNILSGLSKQNTRKERRLFVV